MTQAHRSTRPHRVPRWIPLAAALPAALLAAALLSPPSLAATTVWRCGDSYQDQPCAQGQALTVDDGRSAAQQRAAQAHAEQQQALARDLAKERLARARQQRPATVAAGIRVRQPEVNALPEDNPCQRQQALHGQRRAVRCANGQPIYVAQPAAR